MYISREWKAERMKKMRFKKNILWSVKIYLLSHVLYSHNIQFFSHLNSFRKQIFPTRCHLTIKCILENRFQNTTTGKYWSNFLSRYRIVQLFVLKKNRFQKLSNEQFYKKHLRKKLHKYVPSKIKFCINLCIY